MFSLGNVTEGFLVNMDQLDRNGVGWFPITMWKTSTSRPYFALPSPSVLSSRRYYVAQSDGLFIVSVSLRVQSYEASYVSIAITLDSAAPPTDSIVVRHNRYGVKWMEEMLIASKLKFFFGLLPLDLQ